ncbi:MAG: NADPH-dependent F420 reductase [Methanosarcinales archaeon]|nr:NADPH-dependent F420 reductase [Methanosarcinales archaeon]
MKIAILGGTGSIGGGLALRWAMGHEIIIGSRKYEKAELTADEYIKVLEEAGNNCTISGCANADAVKEADIIVLSVPYEHIESTIETIKPNLENQIVISIVVPMEKAGCFKYKTPLSGSAAMQIRNLLPNGVKLVSAFHNVSAKKLYMIDKKLDMDVFICGDDDKANNVVCKLVKDINKLKPLIAGPLEVSSMVESLTPLLVNLAIYNKMKHLGIKCV